MKVRQRLAFRFTLVAGLVLGTILLFTYLHDLDYARKEFRDRLLDQAEDEAVFWLRHSELPRQLVQDREPHDYGLSSEVIHILDTNYRVIFSDPAQAPVPDMEKLRELTHGKDRVWYTDSVTQAGVHIHFQGTPYLVMISGRDVYGQEELRRMRVFLLLAFLGGIALLYWAGYGFARRALRPVSRMVGEVKEIEASNLQRRLAVERLHNRPDELEELALTFNDMLNRLETSFELQRRFVQHASHELQTPLTMIISEIELKLSRERDPADYRDTLRSVLAEAERLTALNRSLLMLARLEGAEMAPRAERIRADELLEEVAASARHAHPEREIRLNFQRMPENPEELELQGSRMLLRIALENLVQNALKYSEGPVTVTLNADASGVEIQVADQGIGIPVEDLPNILQPLYRASNAHGVRGTGLGLAIVKRVVEFHQGRLNVQSREGEGTQATLAFPGGGQV